MNIQPTITEILFTLAFITLLLKWNEGSFHSVKTNHFSFDEINACGDVYFHIISFRVLFSRYFVTRNEILFLSKWPQWSNTCNEITHGLYQVNTRPGTEMKIFHFARNEISWNHPFNWLFYFRIFNSISLLIWCEILSYVSIVKLGMKLVQIYQDFWTFCDKNV